MKSRTTSKISKEPSLVSSISVVYQVIEFPRYISEFFTRNKISQRDFSSYQNSYRELLLKMITKIFSSQDFVFLRHSKKESTLDFQITANNLEKTIKYTKQFQFLYANNFELPHFTQRTNFLQSFFTCYKNSY